MKLIPSMVCAALKVCVGGGGPLDDLLREKEGAYQHPDEVGGSWCVFGGERP